MTIGDVYAPLGDRPDPSKLIIFIILTALWDYRALGDILTSIVSNSHFGKRSIARLMSFLAFICSRMSPTIHFLIDEVLYPGP